MEDTQVSEAQVEEALSGELKSGSDVIKDELATSNSLTTSTSSGSDDAPSFLDGSAPKADLVRMHRGMAQDAAKALKESRGDKADKEKQARFLEGFYSALLEEDVQMSIDFLEGNEEQQTAQIVIAPNDTVLKFTFSLTEALEKLDNDDEMDGPEKNWVEVLLRLADVILGKDKLMGMRTHWMKKRAELYKNRPLLYLLALSRTPVSIKKKTIEMLGGGFPLLIESARLKQLWQTPESQAAIVDLLQHAPDQIARDFIQKLLRYNILHLSRVNAFEARLAWELMLTLPQDEREDLVDGTDEKAPIRKLRKHKRKLEKVVFDERFESVYTAEQRAQFWEERQEVKKDLRKERRDRAFASVVKKRLSKEYRESSRFDTYTGEKNEAASESLTTESAKLSQESVSQDSDKQSLMTRAIDPKLWEGPDAPLRAVLRMVIQADLAGAVKPLVQQHYARHESMLIALGFDGDGRFVEHIQDKTISSTWLTILAGLASITDVLGILGVLVGGKSSAQLDLSKVRHLANDFVGLGIDLERVEHEHALWLVDALGGISGFAAEVLTVGQVFTKNPTELIRVLKMGTRAGKVIRDAATGELSVVEVAGAASEATGIAFDKMGMDGLENTATSVVTGGMDFLDGRKREKTLNQSLDGDDASADERLKNKLYLRQDDKTGLTQLDLPLFTGAGMATHFGTTTIKFGLGALKNVHIDIKLPGREDARREASVQIGSALIADVLYAGPESMLNIGSMGLEGLKISLKLEDVKPASLLQRVLEQIVQTLIDVMKLVPVAELGVAFSAVGAIRQGIETTTKGMDMAFSSEVEQIGLSFASVSVKDVASSSGDYVEVIDIGATSVSADTQIDRSASDLLGQLTGDVDRDREAAKQREKARKKNGEVEQNVQQEERKAVSLNSLLEARRATLTAERDVLKARKKEGKKQVALDEQIAWYDAQLEDLSPERLGPVIKLRAKLVAELNGVLDRYDLLLRKDSEQLNDKERAELKTLPAEITAKWQSFTLALTENVDFSLGAITARKVSWGGVNIDEFTSTQMGLKNEDKRPEQGDNLGKMELKGFSMGSSERRDEAVAAAITEQRKAITALTKKLSAESDEDKRLELQGQIQAAEKKIIILQKELADLCPLVKEYELLRRRLTDAENPMTEAERGRYQEVRARLFGGKDVSVDRVEVGGINIGTNSKDVQNLLFGTGPQVSGTQASIEVGNVNVEGVTISGGQGYDRSGDTRIKNIAATSAELSLHGGLAEGLINFSMKQAKVEKVEIDGTRSTLLARREQITSEMDEIQAELAQIEARKSAGATDAERLALLMDRQFSLGVRRDEIDTELQKRDKLVAFQAELETLAKGLVDARGIDRSRGYSLQAAIKSREAKDAEIKKLRGAPLAAIQKNLDKYTEAVSNLEKRLEDLKKSEIKDAPLPLSGKSQVRLQQEMADFTRDEMDELGPRTMEEKSDQTFNRADQAKIQGYLASCVSYKESWEYKKQDLLDKIASLRRERGDVVKLEGAYRKLLAQAVAAGIDLPEATLQQLSAELLRQQVEAEIAGWEDFSVGLVEVNGVDLDVTGVDIADDLMESADIKKGDSDEVKKQKQEALQKKKDEALKKKTFSLGNLSEVVERADGTKERQLADTDDPIVQNITVRDVKQGDQTILEEAKLDDIGGDIKVIGTDKVQLTDFGLGSMSLTEVDYRSPGMIFQSKGTTTLDDVRVSMTMDLSENAGPMVLDKLSIKSASSPGIAVGYGDQLYTMGKTSLGKKGDAVELDEKPAVKGMVLTGLNMGSYSIGSLTLSDLETNKLKANLTAGMEVSATKLKAKTFTMGTLVTPQAIARARKQAELDGTLDEFDESLVGFDIVNISAKQMEGTGVNVKALEYGFDATIASMAGDFDNISYDMVTGAIGVRGLVLPTVTLGKIEIGMDGMLVSLGGASLKQVKMDASGAFMSEKEVAKLRKDGLPDLKSFTIAKLSASGVDLRRLRIKMASSSGAQDIRLDRATSSYFELAGYDYNTNALNVKLKGTEVTGLEAKMTSALSTDTFSGDFGADSLDLGMLKNGDIIVDFDRLRSSGAQYEQRSKVRDGGEFEGGVTDVGIEGFDYASGKVEMRGDTTTFTDITLDDFKLPDLFWSFIQGNATTAVMGTNVKLSQPLVSGYYTSKMVETTLPTGDVVELPESELYLEELRIGELSAQEFTYMGESTDPVTGVVSYGEVVLGGERGPAKATNIVISGLKLDGGNVTSGRIDIDSADIPVNYSDWNGLIRSEANQAMQFGSNIKADQLWIEFQEDGDLIRAGTNTYNDTVGLEDVRFSLEQPSGVLDVFVPSASVSGVSLGMRTENEENERSSSMWVSVDALTVNTDGEFTYTRSDEPELTKQDGEKSRSELRQEMLDAEASAATRSLIEQQLVDQDSMIEALLKTIDGDIRFSVGVEGYFSPGVIEIEDGIVQEVVIPFEDELLIALMALGEASKLLAGPVIGGLISTIAVGGGLLARATIEIIEWADVITLERIYDNARPNLNDGTQAATAEARGSFATAQRGGRSHDEQAYEAYRQRVSSIRDAREALRIAEQGADIRLIDQRQAALDALLGIEPPSDWDVSIANINATLSGGPLKDFEILPLRLGDGFDNNVLERISLEKFELALQDRGNGVAEADIDLSGIEYASLRTDKNGNATYTGLKVGTVDIDTELQRLLPGGQLVLSGGRPDEMLENPIAGQIKAGSKISDIQVSTSSTFMRTGKNADKD